MGDDMQKIVMQKGVAGLGNRLQILGRCVDLAQEIGAKVYPDWRDRCWVLGWHAYLTLGALSECEMPQDVPPETIYPPHWATENRYIAETCLRQWYGHIRADSIPSTAELSVYMGYNAGYSDELFRHLRLRPGMLTALGARMWLSRLEPGGYNCWHIRHNDKKSKPEDIEEAFAAMESSTLPPVLLTDNIALNGRADQAGISCPSFLPAQRPRGGGVHHMDLCAFDRGMCNASAIADLWIGGMAHEFHAICPASTFSQFIERGRKHIVDGRNYFERTGFAAEKGQAE